MHCLQDSQSTQFESQLGWWLLCQLIFIVAPFCAGEDLFSTLKWTIYSSLQIVTLVTFHGHSLFSFHSVKPVQLEHPKITSEI